jgi:hypothetical protein
MNSFGIADDIDNAYNMLMESTGSKLVYHYATMDHGKFDIGFVGTGEELAKYGMGIYFTSTLESARHYQRNGKGDGVIYECKIFLDGQSNILDWDALVDSIDIVDIVTQYYGTLYSMLGEPIEAMKFLRDYGFDGITYVSGETGTDVRNYVVFDDSNIKILGKM